MKRLPPSPEFAVPLRVQQMWEAFDYPDDLGGGGPVIPTEGGGAPTIVVAASNASDLSKSKADIVCIGLNDQVTIRSAVDILSSTGGRILFTEGDYQITLDVPAPGATIEMPDHVHWQGMGPNATRFLITPDTGAQVFIEGATNNVFSDCWIGVVGT